MTAIDDEVDLGPEVPDFGSAPPPQDVVPVGVGPSGPPRGGLRPPPVVAITADNSNRNQDAQVLQAAQGERTPGATYTMGIPAETPSSPSFQGRRDKQEQDFLKATYEHAKNIAQAVKDVAAARTMLGIMRVQQDKAGGMDVREANLRNMDYFTNPGDAHFAPAFNALRAPPPAPTVQNFAIPGSKDKIPAFVTKDEKGQSHIQAIPRSALPSEEKEILPKIIELEGEKYVVNPSTGHFEKKDKGKTTELLTPAQMGTQLYNRAKIVQFELKNATDDDEKKLLNQELGYIKGKFQQIGKARGAAQAATPSPSMGVPPPAAQPSERVRVKSPDGKVGTVSRSNLDKATKAGYSVMDAD